MSTVKVKENEPFDVALEDLKGLSKKQAYLMIYVLENFTKSQLGSVKEKLLLQ